MNGFNSKLNCDIVSWSWSSISLWTFIHISCIYQCITVAMKSSHFWLHEWFQFKTQLWHCFMKLIFYIFVDIYPYILYRSIYHHAILKCPAAAHTYTMTNICANQPCCKSENISREIICPWRAGLVTAFTVIITNGNSQHWWHRIVLRSEEWNSRIYGIAVFI